jgi:hypothetical protein
MLMIHIVLIPCISVAVVADQRKGKFNYCLVAEHRSGTKKCTAYGNMYCVLVIFPLQPSLTPPC